MKDDIRLEFLQGLDLAFGVNVKKGNILVRSDIKVQNRGLIPGGLDGCAAERGCRHVCAGNARFAFDKIRFGRPFFIEPGGDKASCLGGIIRGKKQVIGGFLGVAEMSGIRCRDIRHFIFGHCRCQGFGVSRAPPQDRHAFFLFKQVILGQRFGDPVAVIKLKQFDGLAVDAAGVIDIIDGFRNAQRVILAHIRCRAGHVVERTDIDFFSPSSSPCDQNHRHPEAHEKF